MMKDFRLFDIYDFLMDEDFIRWAREATDADEAFWTEWLENNPDKYIVVTEARRILRSFGHEPKRITATEKSAETERLMRTIRGESQDQPVSIESYKVKRNYKWWYMAAACLTALAIWTASFLLAPGKSLQAKYAYGAVTNTKRLVENVNTTSETASINLPDGSVVALAAGSRIGYANNFDSAATRDIYLSGEAFFTVAKNPARPFRVFANEIVTKVLGTSFRIRAFEKDSAIKVTVRTGKVSVYSQAAPNAKETSLPNDLSGIILTPNQELVYQREPQKFQKILLNNPVMVLPGTADKNLLYEDASLIKVFNQLGGNYGINIVYDSEALQKCTITADLRNVPFYEKLDLMCKAVGASYEVIDGQVVIQANGCE